MHSWALPRLWNIYIKFTFFASPSFTCIYILIRIIYAKYIDIDISTSILALCTLFFVWLSVHHSDLHAIESNWLMYLRAFYKKNEELLSFNNFSVTALDYCTVCWVSCCTTRYYNSTFEFIYCTSLLLG